MIGSITMLGYIIMAILYRWPRRGWKSIYKYITINYKSPEKSIDIFNREAILIVHLKKLKHKFKCAVLLDYGQKVI